MFTWHKRWTGSTTRHGWLLGGQWWYSNLLFLNLDIRKGWLVNISPSPAYQRGKDLRCPLYRFQGGSQSQSMQKLKEKFSTSIGDRAPVAKSLVRHYTDWASRLALLSTKSTLNICVKCVHSDTIKKLFPQESLKWVSSFQHIFSSVPSIYLGCSRIF
jgi:hypothetical protein